MIKGTKNLHQLSRVMLESCMETRARSFLKAFTFRLFGLFGTALIVWLVTRRVDWAATVGVVDTVIKIIAFYFHERMWQQIPYGKEHIEYQI